MNRRAQIQTVFTSLLFVGLLLVDVRVASAQDASPRAEIISARGELAQSRDTRRGPAVSSADNGALDCTTVAACQFYEEIPNPAFQPGVAFYLSNDLLVDVEIAIHDGYDCTGEFVDYFAQQMNLPAGYNPLYLRYTPPLAEGYSYSIVWRLNGSCETTCVNSTVAFEPAVCEGEPAPF